MTDHSAGGAAPAAGVPAAKPSRRRAGRRPEVTREDWIEAGLAELGRNGAGALRLDTLCQRLGITKGSFYWYFENREAFLQVLIDRWESHDTVALIEHVEAAGGSPQTRLRALFAEANSGRVVFRTEQAIRQWGNANPDIRRRLHQADRRRIDYMVGLFGALGADAALAETQAGLLYSLILGEAMIFRREARAERLARQQAALEAILSLSPGGGGGPGRAPGGG
jgi:AcrR family transcriptional regulator